MPRRYADTSLGQVHLRRQAGARPCCCSARPAARCACSTHSFRCSRARSTSTLCRICPGSGSSDPLPPGAGITALAACMVQVLASPGGRTRPRVRLSRHRQQQTARPWLPAGRSAFTGWRRQARAIRSFRRTSSATARSAGRTRRLRRSGSARVRGEGGSRLGDAPQRNVNDLWWPRVRGTRGRSAPGRWPRRDARCSTSSSASTAFRRCTRPISPTTPTGPSAAHRSASAGAGGRNARREPQARPAGGPGMRRSGTRPRFLCRLMAFATLRIRRTSSPPCCSNSSAVDERPKKTTFGRQRHERTIALPTTLPCPVTVLGGDPGLGI